jgi:hypothetical protein
VFEAASDIILAVSDAFEEASFTFEVEVSYFLKPATNARD